MVKKTQKGFHPIRRIASTFETSRDLTILYDRYPAMKGLRKASLYFGIFRGLMELSVQYSTFSNLPEIGLLSAFTGIGFNVPGDFLGERLATHFVNEKLQVINPEYKVMAFKDEHCEFLRSPEMHARVSLEDYLKKQYFKSDAEFSGRYLSNVGKINKILQDDKTEQQRINEIGNMLFGQKSPVPAKDKTLEELIGDLRRIDHDNADSSLRKFYGEISAIPANIPTQNRLWTRRTYVDLVRNMVSVIKNGYFDEIDKELGIIRDAEETIKGIKGGKKPKREDYAELERISKEFLAFLLTNQQYLPRGEENQGEAAKALEDAGKGQNMETLASQVASMKAMLIKIEAKGIGKDTAELDGLLSYIKSWEFAMRKAGVSEKRTYCSLAEAQKRFIDFPIIEYTRKLTKEEVQSIVDISFKEAQRTTRFEIGTHVALFAGLVISLVKPEFSPEKIINALSWGLGLGTRSPCGELLCNKRQ